jgi:Imm-5 like putative immunity protein
MLSEHQFMPILPADRDPRLITVRRGGTLTDEDHRLLAEWAALCAEHVLHLFEQAQPNDTRPRDAIDIGRAWVRGEVRMRDARRAAFSANAAGRDLPEPAKYAALAAGQAAAVAHVAAHDLGAAAYAIRAAAADASTSGEAKAARIAERDWQRERIPAEVRELVLDDQRRRRAICWNVFDD